MKLIVTATLIASTIFFIIDFFWLTFAVKSFYKPNIGNLLLDKPIIWAAALFYVVYTIGIAILIIEPGIDSNNYLKLLVKGFIFGLVAYGTYNLTNMATLNGWSSTVVVVDMIWGGFLTALSSFMGIYITRIFF